MAKIQVEVRYAYGLQPTRQMVSKRAIQELGVSEYIHVRQGHNRYIGL